MTSPAFQAYQQGYWDQSYPESILNPIPPGQSNPKITAASLSSLSQADLVVSGVVASSFDGVDLNDPRIMGWGCKYLTTSPMLAISGGMDAGGTPTHRTGVCTGDGPTIGATITVIGFTDAIGNIIPGTGLTVNWVILA